MGINKKTLEKIKRRYEKQNKILIDRYKQSGNTTLLEVVFTDSQNAEEISNEFGISLEDAWLIIESNEKLRKDAEAQKESMKKQNESETDSPDSKNDDEETETADEDEEFAEDDSETDSNDFISVSGKIIEALCFFGDVVQDASEKICDILDMSVDRINKFDFDE